MTGKVANLHPHKLYPRVFHKLAAAVKSDEIEFSPLCQFDPKHALWPSDC